MKILLLALIVVLILWIFFSLYAIHGLEEPKYTVVEKRDGYEIREYTSYIVAEVETQGDMNTALSSGFRILAAYIFGGNTTKDAIAMTTPVLETTQTSEKIAMTTPVLETTSNGKHIIAFTLPSKYTLKNLPKPLDARVTFREVPSAKRAVLRYSWYATEKRVDAKKALLMQKLVTDNIQVLGNPTSAQYNPPLSFPFLRRNEILIDIQE